MKTKYLFLLLATIILCSGCGENNIKTKSNAVKVSEEVETSDEQGVDKETEEYLKSGKIVINDKEISLHMKLNDVLDATGLKQSDLENYNEGVYIASDGDSNFQFLLSSDDYDEAIVEGIWLLTKSYRDTARYGDQTERDKYNLYVEADKTSIVVPGDVKINDDISTLQAKYGKSSISFDASVSDPSDSYYWSYEEENYSYNLDVRVNSDTGEIWGLDYYINKL